MHQAKMSYMIDDLKDLKRRRGHLHSDWKLLILLNSIVWYRSQSKQEAEKQTGVNKLRVGGIYQTRHTASDGIEKSINLD
jgi:hypothetical protein